MPQTIESALCEVFAEAMNEAFVDCVVHGEAFVWCEEASAVAADVSAAREKMAEKIIELIETALQRQCSNNKHIPTERPTTGPRK
jgi:hypothetical protein